VTTSVSAARLSTGVVGLDAILGGGLLPGTLTVVVGATGIGKTQLGLQFAHAGTQQEQRPGVIFDMSARGDSQSHAAYAERMFAWKLAAVDAGANVDFTDFYGSERDFGDYLHIFNYQGRRVTKRDLDWDDWRNWQAELNSRLRAAIAFLYGNFMRGKRRVVVDGIEPVDNPSDSIQFHLFDYVLHQILRKDPEWVARDLFREAYLKNAAAAAEHTYATNSLGCLLLVTSHHTMLDDLISRPLNEGDELANANTLIYMGKTRDGNKMGRGIYIAKHRGSACDERIVPYVINDRGLQIEA
jgi:KaiC/GvpD/RAD55 family RecA-like ATPase